MSQPLIVHEFAPGYRLGSGVTPLYTDVTNRVHSRWRCQRGQQYQRGQAQAGTYNAGWRNTDGYLDPSNTASPYWPGLLNLFVPVRVRAQYPATQNLLTGDQATAGEVTPIAPGAIPAAMNIGGFYATPTIVASGTAWQGGQVYQAAVGAAVASGHELLTLSSVPIRAASAGLPTTTYAWSVYVRSATAGANPTVAAAIEWVTPTGTAVSTSTGSTSVLTGATSASWTRVTVVASPPAGATAATLAVMLSGTVPAGAWSFQADGLQDEILALGANAATAWTQPGTWYAWWAGATVGDPRVYTGDGVPDRSGNYSLAQITATDVIGLMAQDKLNDCYVEELLTYNPNFIYTLSLPGSSAGSVPAQDWTGQRPAVAGYATGGKYTPGASATPNSNTDATSVPQGVSGSVVSCPAGAWFYDQGPTGGPSNYWTSSGVDLGSSGVVGPPANSAWTRIMAFTMINLLSTYEAPAAGDNGAAYLKESLFNFGGYGPNNVPSLNLSMYQPITWSGGVPTYGSKVLWLEGYTANATHINVTWPASSYILDLNQWLLCAVSLDPTGMTFNIRLQGLTGGMTKYTTGTGGTDFRATGINYYLTDTLGFAAQPWLQAGPLSGVTTPGPLWQWSMQGQLGPVAELPFEINDTQFGDLASAWATAYTGDTSGARASRILTWGGWSGSSTVDTGSTTMGGAGGLGSSTGPYSGQAPLSVLQAAALAEHGMVYAQADGTPAFRGRTYRWAQVVPAVTFGEGLPMGASGEVPYTEVSPGYDNAQTINIAQWTVGSGGPGHTAVPVSSINLPSIAASYPQSVQQSLNTADTTQATYLAQWLSNAQDTPSDRVATLRVDAAGTSGVWAQVLGLELDTLIGVRRRPLGGNALSFNAFVENIAWDVVPNRSAVVTYQASPQVFDMPWIPALMHTTLNVQANSGTNTLTINAMAGASSLPLSQLLPGGWQLVLDPANPALTETVTVSPTGIPTTAPGWTTATITLSGNLAHTHAAGAVVCEPLPAGVTDPTIYDSRSILAAASTTVAVQANAGTNTVTINALAGAQYNPLNLLVPGNWTLWLSPGTPRSEVVTVAPGGIPQTNPGWRTATITLTANLAQTHLVGDTVCDPLPAGMTNPLQLVGTVVPGF